MSEKNSTKAELLAPAGSFEGLQAVVYAGADAVYLGGDLFGARAYARNFDREELLKAIDFVHLYGRKLYLTVNTLLKEEELSTTLYDYLAPLYEAGLDAVLVQDMGVLSCIKRWFPELSLHASTQMNVTGPEGVRFLWNEGVRRVVTARELSLKELQQIKAACPEMELEAFIHGALCYCYSGRCLMSSLIGGRSGNRGRCAQPCRLPYKNGSFPSKGTRGEFCPLSPKDMCAVSLLPDILESGVCSLKIEGRMKQPAYASGVTAIYRKYLDLYLRNGREGYRVDPADLKTLTDLFSRGGSSEGYYRKPKGPHMIDFYPDKKTSGEGTVPSPVRIPVKGELTLHKTEPSILRLKAGEYKISLKGTPVQEAVSSPVSEERIRKQMDRLGETHFFWENLSVNMDPDIFISMGELNDLRRKAIQALSEEILHPYRRTSCPVKEELLPAQKRVEGDSIQCLLTVSCETKEQAEAMLHENGIDCLYVPWQALDHCLDTLKASGSEHPAVFLNLPQINRGVLPPSFRKEMQEYLQKGLSGFVCRDLEMAASFHEWGLASCCVLDASLYTWNNEAIRFWKEKGFQRLTAPLELNERELSGRDPYVSEIIVYGRSPMMVSVQCLQKNLDRCTRDERLLTLTDRTRAKFPVQCVCRPGKAKDTDGDRHCYNIIYNSIPTGLLKESERVLKLQPSAVRLSFTTERGEEARKILAVFRAAYRDGAVPENSLTLTRGHFRRGVV